MPVGASGVDELYLSLNNGEIWGKRLHVPARLPFWIGLGPLGLWPLSPPFRVPVRQRIGHPIDVRALVEETARLAGTPMSWQDLLAAPSARHVLALAHKRIQLEVQAILDDLNRRRPA